MDKQSIIQIAESMGFKLDYDKYDDASYPGNSSNVRFLRFVCEDDSLDEKDLRWVWYKRSSDKDNIERGERIRARLIKKKQIQDFLKY